MKIYIDPQLAADIAMEWDSQGAAELVREALVYFAFDYDRSQRNPDLPISLENDGAFLKHLLNAQGEEWLEGHLRDAVAEYRLLVEGDSIDPDFLEAYRRTIEAILALEPGSPEAIQLGEVIDRVFEGVG